MRRCRAISIGLTVVSFAVAVHADEPTKTYTETIPGSAVRFEMIAIPGGTFLMGSSRFDRARYAWFEANSDDKTHPVGRKTANPWGLHDMTGNAAEWCLDRYLEDAYSKISSGRPSVGPVLLPTSAAYPHVARGGSWADRAAACRSAARRSDPTWHQTDPDGSIWWVWDADFVGFRVVRAVEEQDDLKGLRSLARKAAR
jgi:formylglycine-generating enzyme required for sulfatase activity